MTLHKLLYDITRYNHFYQTLHLLIKPSNISLFYVNHVLSCKNGNGRPLFLIVRLNTGERAYLRTWSQAKISPDLKGQIGKTWKAPRTQLPTFTLTCMKAFGIMHVTIESNHFPSLHSACCLFIDISPDVTLHADIIRMPNATLFSIVIVHINIFFTGRE